MQLCRSAPSSSEAVRPRAARCRRAHRSNRLRPRRGEPFYYSIIENNDKNPIERLSHKIFSKVDLVSVATAPRTSRRKNMVSAVVKLRRRPGDTSAGLALLSVACLPGKSEDKRL